MNKFKKFVAAALASATMFATGITAFAETSVSEDAVTKFDLGKTYTLVGEGTSPAETFTVKQTSSSVTDGEATTAPALIDNNGVTFTYQAGGATQAGDKTTAEVTLPTYTNVGVYSYTLEEEAGNTAGVTYDSKEVTVKVTVVNSATEGKTFDCYVAVYKDGKKIKAEDAFSNTYSANSLKVSKTVAGNLGDKTKYFEFKVTLTGEEGKTYGDSYAITGGSYESNPTSATVGAETTVYLKDGETVSIANLPAGVTYTVTETAVEGYETAKSNDSGTISADEASEAKFTNTKSGDIDTGINLTTLPYILVFAGVVAAGAYVVISRRNRFED